MLAGRDQRKSDDGESEKEEGFLAALGIMELRVRSELR
jgi:hypothetical protein